MNDSDGKSETASPELITESTVALEFGEAVRTNTPQRLSGKVECRVNAMLSGPEPRIWIVTEYGSFHATLSDNQVALMVEEGSKFIADKIRNQAK